MSLRSVGVVGLVAAFLLAGWASWDVAAETWGFAGSDDALAAVDDSSDAAQSPRSGNSTGRVGAWVVVADEGFHPGEVAVSVGESVAWVNARATSHTLAIPGLDFSVQLAPGESTRLRFDAPGVHAVDGALQPEFAGAITVLREDAGSDSGLDDVDLSSDAPVEEEWTDGADRGDEFARGAAQDAPFEGSGWSGDGWPASGAISEPGGSGGDVAGGVDIADAIRRAYAGEFDDGDDAAPDREKRAGARARDPATADGGDGSRGATRDLRHERAMSSRHEEADRGLGAQGAARDRGSGEKHPGVGGLRERGAAALRDEVERVDQVDLSKDFDGARAPRKVIEPLPRRNP